MIRRLTRKDVDGLNRAGLLELGLLIFQALPEFYEKVPLDREALLLLLTEQVDVPGTEVAELYGFFEGDSLSESCRSSMRRRLKTPRPPERSLLSGG